MLHMRTVNNQLPSPTALFARAHEETFLWLGRPLSVMDGRIIDTKVA